MLVFLAQIRGSAAAGFLTPQGEGPQVECQSWLPVPSEPGIVSTFYLASDSLPALWRGRGGRPVSQSALLLFLAFGLGQRTLDPFQLLGLAGFLAFLVPKQVYHRGSSWLPGHHCSQNLLAKSKRSKEGCRGPASFHLSSMWG